MYAGELVTPAGHWRIISLGTARAYVEDDQSCPTRVVMKPGTYLPTLTFHGLRLLCRGG